MSNFDKFAGGNFKRNMLSGMKLTSRNSVPQTEAVTDAEPHDLIPFNLAGKDLHPEKHWIHFYVDDYRFERIWNNPMRYVDMLKQFEGAISPDFSVLMDMPRDLQRWNCWRNKFFACLMQQNGIRIIQNVGWSDAESLDWAFEGIPENSILAVTSQGCMGNNLVCKQSFVNGLHELARSKHPMKVYVYGHFPEKWRDRFPMPIIALPTFSQNRFRKGGN